MKLLIAADDYGYAPSYDEGILEAAGAGAIDVAGAMVLRDPDPGPLLDSAIAIGIHLELEPGATAASITEQLNRFTELFGRPPAYLDGHKHCHAAASVAALVAEVAADAGLPVRSVEPEHRRLLRDRGIATPDLLIGRMRASEPVLPAEIAAALDGRAAPATIEWMTHPGHPGGPSSLDSAREEDLALLLRLGDHPRWAERGVARVGPSELHERSV
jgi:predicted glycoside hydrolase/deacetylase ChbG (UPF0249 family)